MFDENSQANEADGKTEMPLSARGDDVDDFGTEEANDHDPKTERTVKFKQRELGVLINHLDKNLENLTGHIKTNEYR